MFLVHSVTVISVTLVILGSVEGNGVQMQRDVQCCMRYSQGKVRTKDVLRFELQTEGPDCGIQAIMQVFQTRKLCASEPRGVAICPGRTVHQEGGKVCRPQRQKGQEVTEEVAGEAEGQDKKDYVAPPTWKPASHVGGHEGWFGWSLCGMRGTFLLPLEESFCHRPSILPVACDPNSAKLADSPVVSCHRLSTWECIVAELSLPYSAESMRVF
ncbi:hypothetical protein DPEC_G00269260 [Dallia pectoralis]|uniref:Uncharacterized protein n=1 Tax=Dallia pectoralis TaxID=75939 RepID=A0ACC2FP37_DALPE|nr:hypothetical protein DPEC_G00269260 [Dallia pectoralis]